MYAQAHLNLLTASCETSTPSERRWITLIHYKNRPVATFRHEEAVASSIVPRRFCLYSLNHKIWLVAFLENRQNCCHQMSDCMAKMHQIRFRLGLRPRPCWVGLQRSPRPPSWISGANFCANLFTVDSRRIVPAH